jgi:ribosomal protein L37AE/L43A
MTCPNCQSEAYKITYSAIGAYCDNCKHKARKPKQAFNTITLTGRHGKAFRELTN